MSARLSPAEIEALRGLLLARAEALRGEVRAALHGGGARAELGLPNRHEDTDDDAIADLQADTEVASVERDLHELREVNAALSRMQAGEYGTCADCGEPIAWERLQAQPQAIRCIGCEHALERRSGERPAPGL